MTHTHTTNEQEIKSIVHNSWIKDETFFDKYSVFESVHESIEDTTTKVLSFLENVQGGEFYNLQLNSNSIGYLVIAKDLRLLYSFAIKKEFRTLEIKRDFLAKIDELFGKGTIAVSLYKKNERALNFFKENGYQEPPQDSITLVKNL